MGQSYKIVTTNLGRTAVRFALAQGASVKLTHIAVGDGGGQDVEPMSSMTELVRETFRAQINEITFDAVHPDMFTAELFIPQSVGGFYIREVGLFMEDGTLFAVGSMPLTEKPDLSSGSASDLLIKIIVRVLDASTISISIDPAQVLATRDYVDRMDRDRIRAAVEAHDKEQAAHDYLARKTLQIKAGTGLSGGGNLEADRTLTVKYGTAAGTACQGNDARLSDARTPKAHKATHKTGGSDVITPADIGAVPTTVQVVAGTGLSGGGTLAANRTLAVKYGTVAGTACQGNDARVTASEAFRLSMIGVPRYWRSTTLPVGHVWANGDLALFSDWPELKKVYDGGGFSGMLLAYNADNATIAANLGKWRPNSANPTGLFVPNLSNQFFRAWTGVAGRDAGSWQQDAIRNIVGKAGIGAQIGLAYPLAMESNSGALGPDGGLGTHSLSAATSEGTFGGLAFDASHSVPTATENRPVNVALPVILYLGLRA